MTEKLVLQFSDIIESALQKFDALNHDDWNHKPFPEKWSKKEILGHLVDSALNNIHRFIRIQHGDQTNIYYEQDFWVRASDYQDQDINEIIALWQAINWQIARVWNRISAEDLSKTIPVKDESPTLQFLMEDYFDHLNHHLRQIV